MAESAALFRSVRRLLFGRPPPSRRDRADLRQLAGWIRVRQDTSAYRGGIYGISADSARQAFFRPSSWGGLRGLWFAGGTTQPGGSPMAALSGQLVAEHIIASFGMG
ncbi:hypothetical protein [Cohnella nanjingensis]|uniref:Amine oxidase domain-containing protein n=1 Tax=Cohnella nanjingensis TaxID=1387779 RepID=A0A7X0VE35_9BACL|nr:hypothetical protein [Cohnella nanjingensis]MBB6669144.1 hypothetical protein [Cohnella nanjingensis]